MKFPTFCSQFSKAAEDTSPTITKTKLGNVFNIMSLLYQSRMMFLLFSFETPDRKEWYFVSLMLFPVQDVILFGGITK